jgi:hypothetical protein
MTQRWDAPDAALLRRILADPPRPPRLAAPRTIFFRDVYFDATSGELRQRGARCRLRFIANGDRSLTILLPSADGKGTRVHSRISERDAAAAFAGDSPAAARLRSLTDPARLAPWIERDVERIWRTRRVPLLRLPLCDLAGDIVTARRGDLSASLTELAICPRPWGHASARRLAATLESAFPLRPVPSGHDPLLRAQAALDAVEGELAARELRGEREVALVAVEHGRIGLYRSGAELRLPVHSGSGEEACRAALRELAGTGEGQLRLLGVVPRSGDRVPLEVWTARRLHQSSTNGAPLQWFAPAELIARVGSPLLRDPGTLAALTIAARSPLVPEWSGAPFGDVETVSSDPDDG